MSSCAPMAENGFQDWLINDDRTSGRPNPRSDFAFTQHSAILDLSTERKEKSYPQRRKKKEAKKKEGKGGGRDGDRLRGPVFPHLFIGQEKKQVLPKKLSRQWGPPQVASVATNALRIVRTTCEVLDRPKRIQA